LGCVQCKGELAENLNGSLAPIRERRARIRDEDVEQILDEGSKEARSVAAETLRAAKCAMKVS
jgi:tryptophanyl-tRNA synthetase